jgi:hypothetical protein
MKENEIIDELKSILSGRYVVGLNFYSIPILILDTSKPIGELFLTIETDWSVHKKNDIPQWISYLRIDDLLNNIHKIRNSEIIGLKYDKLIFEINFRNDFVLALKTSENFEAWSISGQLNNNRIDLICLPGGNLNI